MKSILFPVLVLSSLGLFGMACTIDAGGGECEDDQVELFQNGSSTPKCMATPKACGDTPTCDDQACEDAMYQFCTSANVACSDDGQGRAAITCN